ncbi:YciI family protein [Streptomyces sp. NBC_00878]|uniref:YciI family protein n=1 Tax=Streptomyces sp. NBC_00878 TaxID=2975854 RepID=UPI0022563FB6|nr:YciI family protein [Streptomyces sp. NBC_00878]MCX4904664.1 YciI family protein [Streptomyces sp. NBC_00878]
MWHLTLHRWTGDREATVQHALEHLDDHLAWMREQQLAGKVLIAGPTPDKELGIMLFGHMSKQDVHELCRTDPFISAGLREYEVIPWEVHHLLGIGAFDTRTVNAMNQAKAHQT